MNTRRIAAGFALALSLGAGGLALTGQPAAADGREPTRDPQPRGLQPTCHSVQDCDYLISQCIKFGGDFYVHSVDFLGRPVEGGCTPKTD